MANQKVLKIYREALEKIHGPLIEELLPIDEDQLQDEFRRELVRIAQSGRQLRSLRIARTALKDASYELIDNAKSNS